MRRFKRFVSMITKTSMKRCFNPACCFGFALLLIGQGVAAEDGFALSEEATYDSAIDAVISALDTPVEPVELSPALDTPADPVELGTPADSVGVSPTISIGVGMGGVSYGEDSASDIASDWDSSYVSVVLAENWVFAATNGLYDYVLSVGARVWQADGNTEEWTSGAVLQQENDLDLSGYELFAETGLDFTKDRQVGLRVGVASRVQEHVRGNPTAYVSTLSDSWDDVTEDVSLVYVYGALELSRKVSQNLALEGRVTVGSIFQSEAENSASSVGVIEGTGGEIFNARLGVDWMLSDSSSISLSGVYDFQSIEGDSVTQTSTYISWPYIYRVTTTTEWPDNELERIGAELSYRRTF